MVKVVLDTNVIVSAIVFEGVPHEILQLVLYSQIQGFISKHIITEVRGVLGRKFNFSPAELEGIEILLEGSFTLVEPRLSVKLIKAHIADNRILECALDSQVDYLISGDAKHILPLERVGRLAIVTPSQFLRAYSLQKLKGNK